MENIYTGVDRKSEIRRLRNQGLSIRKIAEQLNISKSSVHLVLRDVIEVSKSVPNLSKSVPNVKEENKLELLTKKEIEIILEEFKEQIEEVIKERIQKSINYYVNNHLDSLLNTKIQALQEKEGD